MIVKAESELHQMVIKGYSHSKEHIADELRRIDLLLYKKIQELSTFEDEPYIEQLKGYVMSENKARSLLKNRSSAMVEEGWSEQYYFLSEYITAMRQKSEEDDTFLSLNYVKNVFHLSPFEEECIIICLAHELDRKYGKLFAYIQDDLNETEPTIDLLLNLTCETEEQKWEARKYFFKQDALMKYFFETEEKEEKRPLLKRRLRLRERIVHFLLEVQLLPIRETEYATISYPYESLPELLTNKEVQEQLKHVFHEEDNNYLFYLSGKEGIGKTLHVKHFCRFLNYSLLLVDLEDVLNSKRPFKEALNIIYRETVLQQSVLCFRNFHLLLNEDHSQSFINEFITALNQFSGTVFLLSEQKWNPFPSVIKEQKNVMEIELTIPNAEERKVLWEKIATSYSFTSDVLFSEISAMFEFTPGQIKYALKDAYNVALTCGKDSNISRERLMEACYKQIDHKLEAKAKKIKPLYKWDDLILPEEAKDLIRQACNQVKYRSVVMNDWGFDKKLSLGKGISMLFSGPPGTGKTMGAEVIANELGLEIYKVDLSQIISKYIGETEKNLKEIFDQANLTNAILLFDEADALFGKRSAVNDSRDKYANVEVAYLLQKIEEYKGISILTTNLLENIDEAFLRRFNFVISFSLPQTEQREKIWRQVFPARTPLDEDIDYSFLAEKLPIAGGNIKNIAVSAAFLAAECGEKVGMNHIIKAAKHEMKKTGRILLLGELEESF